MRDVGFQIGSTAAALVFFVAMMVVAEATPVPSGWGVLIALAAFLFVSSGIGVLIARRAY